MKSSTLLLFCTLLTLSLLQQLTASGDCMIGRSYASSLQKVDTNAKRTPCPNRCLSMIYHIYSQGELIEIETTMCDKDYPSSSCPAIHIGACKCTLSRASLPQYYATLFKYPIPIPQEKVDMSACCFDSVSAATPQDYISKYGKLMQLLTTERRLLIKEMSYGANLYRDSCHPPPPPTPNAGPEKVEGDRQNGCTAAGTSLLLHVTAALLLYAVMQ